MAVSREKIHFASVEELLGAPASTGEGTVEIKVDDIYPFENHPFKVVDDEKMDDLVQSIKENGVLTPVIVRPDDEGTYEMISGHRRLHAAKRAGLYKVPAVIKYLTNDAAVIAMVDANVQREEILPSERAWALKMKLDAMKRQGRRSDLTSAQNERRLETADIVGEEMGISRAQVRRFIRLTELIPELLEIVDKKRLTMAMGVDISYFDKQLQRWIYEYISENGFIKPEQIMAIKVYEDLGSINQQGLIQIMNDSLRPKKISKGVTLTEKKLDRYFSSGVSQKEREKIIINLLERWKQEQEVQA